MRPGVAQRGGPVGAVLHVFLAFELGTHPQWARCAPLLLSEPPWRSGHHPQGGGMELDLAQVCCAKAHATGCRVPGVPGVRLLRPHLGVSFLPFLPSSLLPLPLVCQGPLPMGQVLAWVVSSSVGSHHGARESPPAEQGQGLAAAPPGFPAGGITGAA